ncbi:hypothetical protein PRIPAC_70259 [Pristionchus pacificus]|uniref:Uncharacterized protein n=1 Tax=Pristionchus pacificus TaxID=54126 RepID=A0A2A6CSY3_PRIPA|nr:hypothetical protein PRIPAC_70259 [Pristionchus pacificus]|eukprot:PDM81305.1 hypothetical protein PRIPAC_36308 [Pristionchus pacificus]
MDSSSIESRSIKSLNEFIHKKTYHECVVLEDIAFSHSTSIGVDSLDLREQEQPQQELQAEEPVSSFDVLSRRSERRESTRNEETDSSAL